MSRRRTKGKREERTPLSSATTRESQPATTKISQTPSEASDTQKPVHRRSLWLRIKDHFAYGLIWFFFTSPVVVPILIGIVYVPCYRASLSPQEFTVDRRERVVKESGDSVQSYYLVWSKEGEVFCVNDTWSFMSFDSSDRYGKLHEGSKVTAKVAGWRVPFLSWYRNVVEIVDVKALVGPSVTQ